MNSRTTARFRSCFARLPPDVQRQAREAFKRFVQNPAQSGLRFRQVHPTEPVYSVRVTLDHRALGVRDGDALIWFWIGSPAEYERLLAAL